MNKFLTMTSKKSSKVDINEHYHFKNEKPLVNFTQDKNGLNRGNFAKNLAKNIENYFKFNNDCLTIGLMGEWGSGKTTIINLTKQCLSDEIKIMEFNPWIYSSYNQLIEQFFDELISQFSNERGIAKDLKSYWFKLNKSNFAKSIVPTLVSTKSETIGNIMEKTFNLDSHEMSLGKLKNKINKELSKYNIVCIIDDLDRISVEGINDIFKLIKIMADFNNVIYLLSFDKQMVSKSLDNEYVNGEKYIEKIINVPLDVPLATFPELKKSLKNDLILLSEKHELKFDEARLRFILDYEDPGERKNHGILYFFKNMRDIKRFINILEFNLELVKNEVNFVDFITITSIQLFKPEIYDKVKVNESLLVPYKIVSGEYDFEKNIIEREKEEFELIVGNDENIEYILKFLFPKMRFIYNNGVAINHSSVNDRNLLICHENHFKTYFKLNPIVKDMTEFEIDVTVDYINSENEIEVISKFKNLFDLDKLDLFFERVQYRLNKIKANEFFLRLLFSLDDVDENIYFTIDYTLINISTGLIKKIESNKLRILQEEFNKNHKVHFLLNLIKEIERYNLTHLDENLLSDSEIEILKEILRKKYNMSLWSYDETSPYKLTYYLEMGEDLGLRKVNDKFLEKFISTSQGLILFLESILHKEMDRFVESEIRNINYFISMDLVKDKIDKNYDELKEEILVKKFLKDYDVYQSNKIKESNSSNL